MNVFIIIYLIGINSIGFVLMFVDKRKAIQKRSRVSERSLFTVAWIGGSMGIYLGIFAFRHKTKHKTFVIGVPVILAIQIVLTVILIYYFG